MTMKQPRKGSRLNTQIGLPTRVTNPTMGTSHPDYNPFRDPDLATRSDEFIKKYLSQMDDEDMSILGDLSYGSHGGYFSEEEYKRSMLGDSNLYGEVDLKLEDIEVKTIGAPGQGGKLGIEITNTFTGKKEFVSMDMGNKTFMGWKSNYAKAFIKEQREKIMSEAQYYVKDKGSGKYLDTRDKALQESYFGKMVQQEGVSGMYNRVRSNEMGAQIKEKISGSEGYGSFINKLSEDASFGMMEDYQDALTSSGNAYTNTIDRVNWQALADEDKLRLGL
jgi:hypothetical protein